MATYYPLREDFTVAPPETVSGNPQTGQTTLDSTIVAKKRTARCVPVLTGGSGNTPDASPVEWQTLTLRNYGDTFPGATYRVWKDQLKDPWRDYDAEDNPVVVAGTHFKILLKNWLAYAPGETTVPHECRPAQYAACSDNLQVKCTCDVNNTDCDDLSKYTCVEDDLSPECTVLDIPQQAPNCFHGSEVTNLHYHGTHVSPQPHQDYVSLSLFPYGQPGWPFGFDPDNLPADVALGRYQTDIPTFPWNQAPGTHWYHAHKHGSTATQMINGMAGALLIQGEFDVRINQYFEVSPSQLEDFEKVMIVQQIAEDVLFPLGGKNYPPYPLINGQMVPTVEMKYGETQRWRLVSTTTNAVTQTSFAFPEADFPGFDVRQIAQDGVQFAPKNYERQPLGDSESGFLLSPGNRVDLLIRAPDDPGDGKTRTFYVMKKTVGHVEAEILGVIRGQGEALNRKLGIRAKDSSYDGPLIRIYVSGNAPNPKPLPSESQWPRMPSYLADITQKEIDDSDAVVAKRTMAFSTSTPAPTVGSPKRLRGRSRGWTRSL